jgi:hypothetical protein
LPILSNSMATEFGPVGRLLSACGSCVTSCVNLTEPVMGFCLMGCCRQCAAGCTHCCYPAMLRCGDCVSWSVDQCAACLSHCSCLCSCCGRSGLSCCSLSDCGKCCYAVCWDNACIDFCAESCTQSVSFCCVQCALCVGATCISCARCVARCCGMKVGESDANSRDYAAVPTDDS